MERGLWWMSVGGALLAFVLCLFALMTDNWLDKAVAGASALALTVIPYVLARSVSELAKFPARVKKNKFDIDEDDLSF